ncbi:MAG TPA: hypothetical protein VFJ16_32575, partial [Longimicrobium sp.]|nr:hypothetical protein [Longimicrobium sp.]
MSTHDPTLAVGEYTALPVNELTLEDLAAASPPAEAAEEAEAGPRQVQVKWIFAPGEGEEGGAAALAPPVVPPPPVAVRLVSGLYRSAGAQQLELRVDVDGRRPTGRVSGDFFHLSGATLDYTGSFVVHTPTISVRPNSVTVEGTGAFSTPVVSRRVRVTIPRTPVFAPPGAATVQFLSATGGVGATYVCAYQKPFFRSVQIEEDRVPGVTPFASYNTGSLASPPPPRSLSVMAAYAEAGIEMLPAGVRNVVPMAGVGASWSDAELHAAMVANFSLWKNVAQWKVWLFTAWLHDLGPGLLGIMFDQQGPQRQGCAVFHAGMAGTSPDRQRTQLYTCVHELGHCFNLYHSWQKQFMQPPQPSRPNSMSWMNYPWRFPGGEATFWSGFPFQFDDPELVHLRHGFRRSVIMGGDPFGAGAALEAGELFEHPLQDDSGLALELRGRGTFMLGEPVRAEIKLSALDLRGKTVNANLHPDFGFVQVGVRHPSGRVLLFRPMLEHCVIPATTELSPARPAVYESVNLAYGRDGLYFDAPGVYQLRAVYHAPDGSRVVSNTLPVRVRSPLSTADDEVAGLMLGEEQGALLYLHGSDSPSLRGGNDALQEVIERHGSHPLAVYARLARGANAARQFKHIGDDGRVHARQPDHPAAISDLETAVAAAEDGRTLDNIALNRAIRRLADAHEAAGDEEVAATTAGRMLQLFMHRGVSNPHVQNLIAGQAEAYAP